MLIIRSLVGGVLMGLANLVPGISGGTMLLAAGIYPAFIDAVAEVTTFRFKRRSMFVLGSVAVAAGLGILLLAGTVKDLVVHHRWIMYSLFIGLTLGGIPVLWKMIRKPVASTWVGAVAGFLLMGALAIIQQQGWGTGGSGTAGMVMMFVAGVAGASAMILPGVSGGYLLLVLGQYVPILSAIDTFKEALKNGDVELLIHVGMQVIVPVGLGVLAGVIGVSNLLKWLLRRYCAATLGVLLGLLMGAVVGLWPFQEGVTPEEGDVVKGRVMTGETLAELDPEDYPTSFFTPSGKQVGLVFLACFAGFAVTLGVSKLGGDKSDSTGI